MSRALNGDGSFRAPVWASGRPRLQPGLADRPTPALSRRRHRRRPGRHRGPSATTACGRRCSNGVGGFTSLRPGDPGLYGLAPRGPSAVHGRHHRRSAALTLVGSTPQGMWTARSNGDGTFIYPGFAGSLRRHRLRAGARVRQPDGVADSPRRVRRRRRPEDDGVWTSQGLGNGSFYPAKLALKDFGAHTGDTEVRHVFALDAREPLVRPHARLLRDHRHRRGHRRYGPRSRGVTGCGIQPLPRRHLSPSIVRRSELDAPRPRA